MDCKKVVNERVEWIKNILVDANAKGVVLGMSGGKDSALVGILCKLATKNVTGIIMPCQSKRNLGQDRDDAILLCKKFDIKNLEVDLSKVKADLALALEPLIDDQNPMAYANINPRLRMITVYNYAQRAGYIVAGTGNRSEGTMGYFTKWGDGAYDFNPIADLTVKEIYELLRYLDCPSSIIEKAPSAALFEGQTDEEEMGIKYADLDDYILNGKGTDELKKTVDKVYTATAHKRNLGRVYPN
jgi:NAD+ synthase